MIIIMATTITTRAITTMTLTRKEEQEKECFTGLLFAGVALDLFILKTEAVRGYKIKTIIVNPTTKKRKQIKIVIPIWQ